MGAIMATSPAQRAIPRSSPASLNSSLKYCRLFAPAEQVHVPLQAAAACSGFIASLGMALGMRSTAEGVEAPAQLLRLRAAGCTEAQGYLLGRPVPAAELPALIERFGAAATGRAARTEETVA